MLAFDLSSTKEIVKELASRAKIKRKKLGMTQKQFADHIGMKFSTYARFEKTGLISLNNFVDTLRGLYSIDDLESILIDKNINLQIKW
ncbi:helix-turn-helix transcriptional regulator [Sulfuricurvum sp.]|uniref:helix-turn-helix domain-containing protein n=1 Tax=Sulfuricurvum sp. TaxID=2025608 RepID=UPI002623258F|nr:helix-turn-helix transcriptional regulator [Sulfuricurvum sp.]MDD4950522.1 helix-turn-helix transcriptional regulator [Sulfuricurvum sp.]